MARFTRSLISHALKYAARKMSGSYRLLLAAGAEMVPATILMHVGLGCAFAIN